MPSNAIRAFVLDRPERSNALGAEEWTRLLETLREAEDDRRARVLVVESRGRSFSAGNDLSETASFATPGEARRYFLDAMLPTLAAMATSRLPIVAAVDGPALGGGFELLQYCDVVIASTAATFGLPETGVGLWATIHLATSAVVGDRRIAQRLALTGDRLSAQEALTAQVISEVVDGPAGPRALEVAETIASRAPLATARTKKWANAGVAQHAIPAARRALSELIDETLFAPEAIEGMTAFTEKRAPHF